MITEYIQAMSSLTSLPPQILTRLCTQNVLLAAHELAEGMQEHKQDITLDTAGYGQLVVRIEGKTLRCRLIPSEELTDALLSTSDTGTSKLIEALEEKFLKTLEAKYDDVFEGTKAAIDRKDALRKIGDSLIALLQSEVKVTRKDIINKIVAEFRLYGCELTVKGV